jgi:hypothetical protein
MKPIKERSKELKKYEIEVTVEKGDDKTYTAYISGDNPLPFGLLGDGNNVQEAIDDFKESFNQMRAFYEKSKLEFPENVEFNFKYDMASFLSYYSKILSLSGLEKLTGVNQGQLSHYVTGRRKPSKKTVQKIEEELHNFAEEISQIEFV